jgi:formylmethanofuran dehydrogenase subunit E
MTIGARLTPAVLPAIVALALLLGAAGPAAAQSDEWWSPGWLTASAHSPAFAVYDTVNKYGRYADRTKTITLSDLIKFHGHFCGGLVESAGALRMAFDAIFEDGIIDRTDLRVASNNSACGGDVAAYLTGARTRFGSHLIDPKLTESEFVVQQVSTGKTVRVRVRPEAYPTDVRVQMRKIESGRFQAGGHRPLSGTAVGLCAQNSHAASGRDLHPDRQHGLRLAGDTMQGFRDPQGQYIQGGSRKVNR